MGNEQGKQAAPTTAGIQSMDESLQKKFSKGIQYNMKIVLRGDRNTGKSSLFHRMEGKSFSEAYIPTNEIQVTSILWSYKVTNDTVKVEVWDVVDKGKVQRKESKSMLKLFNQPEKQDTSDIPLDADFLDVYKGAHGVVFMFDITKQWTWRYVEKELPRVPLHVPVMVLASFSDMGEHRVVSKDECRSYIEHLDRPDGAAQVRYAEASMKDGFGLMHLHKFLSVPFLQLQQETMLHQLKVNREQMLAASEELDGAVHTEDQNYDLFLSKLQKLSDEKKRKAQEEQAAEAAGDESPMSPLRSNSNPSPRSPRTPRSAAESPKISRASDSSSQVERSGSFTSKLTSHFPKFFSRRKEESKQEQPSPIVPKRQPRRPASSSNVDDFVPEGEVDKKFFGGEDSEEEEEEEEDSEEESEEAVNPQVAMDEDLSSQEDGSAPPTSVAMATPPPSRPQQPKVKPKSPPIKLKSAKDIVLTESEEEDMDYPRTRPAQPKATPKSKPEDDVFSTSTPKTSTAKKTSKGLLLEFNLPSSKGSAQAKPESSHAADSPSSKPRERKSLSTESPSEPRERKRKKSKKSRHKEEEGGGGPPAGPPAAPPASEDPFGLTSSLDAWLNAGTEESSKLGKVLQPSQVGSTEKEAEVGVAEEEERGHRHHHKKHKHRKQEEGSTHKKHKHRSRHSHEEQPPGTYEVL